MHVPQRRIRFLGAPVLLTLMALVGGACAEPPEDAPVGGTPPVDRAAREAAVDAVLDDLHRLASEGAFESYFQLFADDAVFMGTDASERWSVDDFRGYAAASSGWTYERTERHIFLSEDANTAWFDERLQNANYGETRGTGVLIRTEAGWKIVQYNLTIPIPNDLAREFVDRIRAYEQG